MTPNEHDRFRLTDLEAEGLPDIDEQPAGVDDDTAVEAAVPPSDRPRASARYGTTVAEQRGDEPVRHRVRREEPEVESGAAPRPGQLVHPDGGMIDVDDEGAAVAEEAVDDTAGLSAEEAAEHLEEP